MSNEQLLSEACDFLNWLREMGVRVWTDWETQELVFTPRSRMNGQMVAEAHRLRDCLAGLIGPEWPGLVNPYQRSWN